MAELKNVDNTMRVFSRNLKLGKDEFKQITNFALTMKNAKLIKITDEKSGSSIKCTPEHKVFTVNRGYVEAKFLKEDDELLLM